MTTSVKIDAHCANTKEVKIHVINDVDGVIKQEFVLQDGESKSCIVYDHLEIHVKEVVKQRPAPSL